MGMDFDDWDQLMRGEYDEGHEGDWMEWADTTKEERDIGSAPSVDEVDVWSWLKMEIWEIKDLLTKSNVSLADAVRRNEIDNFVLDCHDRGVSLAQLSSVLRLNVDGSGHSRALMRSVTRAKLVRQRQ